MARKQSLEKSLHILTGGDEPKVTKDGYKLDMIKALNWYNANREEKDYRAYAERYVKSSPELKPFVYAVSKADFLEIRSVGVVGRLVQRGQYVAVADVLRAVDTLHRLGKKYQKPTKSVQKPEGKVLSVQDRINEAAKLHIAELEAELDGFAVTKQSEFNIKGYLHTNQVSAPVAKRIGDWFVPVAAELKEARTSNDPQLKEGYSNFNRRQLARFSEFVSDIVAACTQQVVTAKAVRKPRVSKQKPASVLAAKIKPMREFPELGLKSIEPAKIIGASELWTYCPETRKMTVYRADSGTLGVSGMSVTNYSVELSETKTIRKPEEFFKGLSSMGKRAMANAWKALTTKPSEVRARLSDKIILLTAN